MRQGENHHTEDAQHPVAAERQQRQASGLADVYAEDDVDALRQEALRDGAINAEEFVTQNEIVGGNDRDSTPRAERSSADADALAIAFVEPFVVLILGSFLFGDEVGPRRIAASAVGFGGALLVIQPSLAAFGYVALWPLGTAFFFAFYMLVTRAISAWPITDLLSMGGLRVQGCFDNFDPVAHGRASSSVEVGLAAYVGCGNEVRFTAFQRIQTIVAKLQ